MKKLSFILGCLLVLATSCFGQNDIISDTLTVDSSLTEPAIPATEKKSGPIRNFLKKGYPNPTKAMVFSFVIPGAGQFYNKKYWKVPIVWGAYGLMIYFIDFSSTQYNFFKQEYIYAVDGDGNTESKLMTIKGWGEDDIKSERDLYRKRMELSYIGLAAVALLSGVDAYVDAHLMGFDVSEDLTMRVRPKVDFMSFEGSSIGVGVSFNLKNKETKPKVFFNNN
jgi:Family of unknown function (DUF5683)